MHAANEVGEYAGVGEGSSEIALERATGSGKEIAIRSRLEIFKWLLRRGLA
jgi:hypothetical protein